MRKYFQRRSSGFTMIEMIGVLAIIAILAVIVVPKVFSTIAGSRVTSTVASVNSMRSAVTEYVGRYGTIPLTTTSANARIDDLLVATNLLDNRFVVKIGTQPSTTFQQGATWDATNNRWNGGASQALQSRIICQTSNTNNPSAANGANFRLSGGTTANLPAGSRVVSAVIVGVPISEARNLSLSIDGEPLSTPLAQATAADNNGKVVYAAAAATGTTTVYVYLAHQ